MTKIKIVAACDDNYVQHLAVMLCSLLENTKKKNIIQINIIDGGISQENKHKINNFIQNKYNTDVKYLKIDHKIYNRFPISYHFTHTIYYRISIPLLFDSSVNKVLYLDSDIIVKDDVSKLWDIDLSNYFLAAVESPNVKRNYCDLNMSKNSKYFNSGVLLINLQKWRQHNITEKTIEFIAKNQDKITWWDQDSLNSVLCNKWLPLPLRWNQQSSFFEQQSYLQNKNNSDFIDAINNPAIIHFSSLRKPWEYISRHPHKKEYFYYLSLTPWQNFKPKVNLIIYLENIIRNHLPRSFFEVTKWIYRNILTNKQDNKTIYLE